MQDEGGKGAEHAGSVYSPIEQLSQELKDWEGIL